jgi:hypothetical protein
MSSGDKAGIAIGVVLGVILVALAFFFVIRKRRATIASLSNLDPISGASNTGPEDKAGYPVVVDTSHSQFVAKHSDLDVIRNLKHPIVTLHQEPISELPAQQQAIAPVPVSELPNTERSNIVAHAHSPTVENAAAPVSELSANADLVEAPTTSVAEMPAPMQKSEHIESPAHLQSHNRLTKAPARSSSVSDKEVVPPVSPKDLSKDELATLKEEQDKLAERRRRLQELLEVDRQEEQVRQRISALQNQPQTQ